jgi:predicted phosphodiesterase
MNHKQPDKRRKLMKQIAILADIHGNSIALQAVLEDIQKHAAVDAYWVLGDLAALGHDPVRVLESLNQLPGVQFIRGNTDSYLANSNPPVPSLETLKKEPDRIQSALHMSASFAWTTGALATGGWLAWLETLPLEMRQTLPDGTRFLGVHASPGTDDGPGIRPNTSEKVFADYAHSANADLVCVGHTHWPIDIEREGVRFFNPGSVSNPVTEDLQASYAILDADESGYKIQSRSVDYDHQAVIDALQRVKHPAAAYIIAYQLGQNKPPWISDGA